MMKLTFKWDGVANKDLAGYRLYRSKISGQYDLGEDKAIRHISAGTHYITVDKVVDGIWYWVVTAFDILGNESLISNEVEVICDSTPPAAPTKLFMASLMRNDGGR